MQTIAFGVDKQWDPAVQHWQLYVVTCDGAWWRIMWEKECVCIYTYIYIYTYTDHIYVRVYVCVRERDFAV